MKTKTLLIVAILALPLTALHAQHGTSPEGLDTWTGQISALNPEKQEITLTDITKKGGKTIVASLPKEEVKQGDKTHGVQMSDLAVGQVIRFTYMKMDYKENGKKISRNLIISIEIVSPSKRS
jgi:hypothetical protein